MIQPVVLDNGTTILLEPIGTTETASAGFWFRSGSRFEGLKEHGFSHFVEHMVFKGTEKRSALRIAQDIDRVGGYLNAFTERENTCFHCTLPATHLKLALDVLCDLAFDATFPEAEFEKERIVIENEILSTRDDVEDLAGDEYLSLVFGRHPLARRIAGTIHSIKATTRDELFEFYRRRYVADDLVIAVSGNFAEADVIGYLADRTADARRSKKGDGHRGLDEQGNFDFPKATPLANGFLPSSRPEWRTVDSYKSGSFQQLQIITGMSMEPPYSIDLYNQTAIFNSAVGDSMSSRLFQNIRERYGYCYSIFSSPAFMSDIGFWTVFASTAPTYSEEMVNRIRSEIEAVAEGGLTPIEIADAKSRIEGETVLGKEDIENRMKRLARQAYFTGEILTVEEGLERIASVSEADIGNFISRYVRPDRFSLLLYGAKIKSKEAATFVRG